MVLIHGKTYVTVAERVALVHQSGKSLEILDSAPVQCGGAWVWRCHILLDGKHYFGSAQVHLDARAGSADSVDAWACAETSAIGRSLAFAGILSEEGIASADEMACPPENNLQQVMADCKAAGLAHDTESWCAFKRRILGRDIANKLLAAHHLAQLRAAIDEEQAA